MWYCKIVDGAINCFANSDNVAIGDEMIPLPEGLDPTNVQVVVSDDGSVTLVKDPNFETSQLDAAWASLRSQRNARLAATDWTQLADAHLSQEKKDAWAAYRQELRDLPDELTDPLAVEWPLDPTQIPPTPVTGSRLSSLLDAAS
jgi:hypothetical protein